MYPWHVFIIILLHQHNMYNKYIEFINRNYHSLIYLVHVMQCIIPIFHYILYWILKFNVIIEVGAWKLSLFLLEYNISCTYIILLNTVVWSQLESCSQRGYYVFIITIFNYDASLAAMYCGHYTTNKQTVWLIAHMRRIKSRIYT